MLDDDDGVLYLLCLGSGVVVVGGCGDLFYGFGCRSSGGGGCLVFWGVWIFFVFILLLLFGLFF